MDKVNILNKDNFPLYAEGLAKIQDQSHFAANLALIGGSNYILSGCVESADRTSVSDGLIVINGELLPLIGAAKKDKIIIRDVKTPLHAFGVDYPESYITRYVEFSANGEYDWNDFERLETNLNLYKQIKNITGDPVGIVKEFAGFVNKIPKDYMLCDGRDISVAEYPELFETLGTIYGGDGVNFFKLPNAGRRVSVGYTGAGDYAAQGNTDGAENVTLTTAQIPEHDHINSSIFNKLSAKAGDINEQATPGSIDKENPAQEYNVGSMSEDRWKSATIQKVGEGKPHENRMPYIVFAKIIKVR